MKRKLPKATRTVYTILRQIATIIPREIVFDAAEKFDIKYRTFDPWSHLVTLVIVQLSRQESLNGICDIAKACAYEWDRAGLAVPRRNTLANANKMRNPAMAETVFWKLLDYLKAIDPDFASGRYEGYLARMKKHRIFLLDSSTIQLALNCFDWAKHRRAKAAAKLHLTLELATRLPSFAVVEEASHHDSTRAASCTANLVNGDVLVADRAYVDFPFFDSLAERGIVFVTRTKQNLLFDTVQEFRQPPEDITTERKTQILSDEKVRPSSKTTQAKFKSYDGCLRRVKALVEVRDEMREMTFLTNNFAWSARTIAELYRARWGIETFFKEIKQTCQIHDFIGYSEKAVKWQVWCGLIAHLLLRYIRHLAEWKSSFSRLAGIVRGSLWLKKKLLSLLSLYGTADAVFLPQIAAKPRVYQLMLPFANAPNGTASA